MFFRLFLRNMVDNTKQEKIVMKRRNVYPFIFLTCLAILIVYFIMPSLSIFGSNTDWHFATC